MLAVDAIAISIGAVAGALSRHSLSQKLATQAPYNIAAINIAGSFALGACAGLPPSPPPTPTQQVGVQIYITCFKLCLEKSYTM